MKKHSLQLLIFCVFLAVTAMTCDDYDIESKQNPCVLTGIEVYSWDNAGDTPQVPTEQKIKKEAYMLEIRLTSDAGTQPDKEIYDNHYKLEDGIVKINIYTEEPFNNDFQKEADVTSCFQDYPARLTKYQIRDCTNQGDTIQYVTPVNQIFKALLVTPQAGTHSFRVVLTTANGDKIERKITPVTLY